jgi:putative membrane protein
MKFLLKFALSACAIMLLAHFLPGVSVTSYGAALIAAFVIGLLNTVVKPVLLILTLPVTILTLGLFYFVLNALMFWAAGSMLKGFEVAGFTAALLGSLAYSVLQLTIEAALDRFFAKPKS